MRRFLVGIFCFLFLHGVYALCPWMSPENVVASCSKKSSLNAAYKAQPTMLFGNYSTSTTRSEEIIEVASNDPVCEGGDLSLEVINAPVHATFKWTGPDGFESIEKNPVISDVTNLASGTYYMTMTHDGISSDPVALEVVVYPTVSVYDTAMIKPGEYYKFGNIKYGSAGDFKQKLKTKDGCDSIIYLHLIKDVPAIPDAPEDGCPWGSPDEVTVFCTDENPLGITYRANKLSTSVMNFGECGTTKKSKFHYFSIEDILFMDSVSLLRESGECDYLDCYAVKYEQKIDEIYENATVYQSCEYRSTGCMRKVVNPAWYAFQIEEGGELALKISHSEGEDIDFACWGPFYGDSKIEMLNKVCEEGLLDDDKLPKAAPSDDWDFTKENFRSEWDYPYGNLRDCSYSHSSLEYCYLPETQKGEWYILVISNYTLSGGYISFNKYSGSATADCHQIVDISSNSPVCEGDNLRLRVLNAPLSATFQWEGPNGFVSTERNPSIAGVTSDASGTYYLTLFNNGEKSEPMPLNVVVNQLEAFDTVYIQKGEVYELGEEVYSESGDYVYSTKSKNGCDSITRLHLVVDDEPVAVTLKHNSPVCEGAVIEIEALGVPDDAVLQWRTPKGATSDLRKFHVEGAQISDAGLYSLTVTLAGGKKIAPIDVLVEVNSSYVVYDTVMVEHGGYYELEGDVYEANNDYEIIYHTVMGCDSVVNLHLTEKEIEKPDVGEEEKPETPEEELPDGEQEENPNDETEEVPEKEQPEVDLPEEGEEEVSLIPSPIFSPNEDGINDLWEIDGIEKFPGAKVEIYDRFGKLLSSYEGYENEKGWDGTYNGEKLPSTDYWYVITVPAISKVYYGHFTLVRR